jgi:hypothetical protein
MTVIQCIYYKLDSEGDLGFNNILYIYIGLKMQHYSVRVKHLS